MSEVYIVLKYSNLILMKNILRLNCKEMDTLFIFQYVCNTLEYILQKHLLSYDVTNYLS